MVLRDFQVDVDNIPNRLHNHYHKTTGIKIDGVSNWSSITVEGIDDGIYEGSVIGTLLGVDGDRTCTSAR